jgi:hypothetical protein
MSLANGKGVAWQRRGTVQDPCPAAGAQPYFDYIDVKRTSQTTSQEQEGNYFCLRSSRFQLIGIDTD